LGPASIDLARLVDNSASRPGDDLDAFLREELASVISDRGERRQGRDVVL